jgi:hypothetical protein
LSRRHARGLLQMLGAVRRLPGSRGVMQRHNDHTACREAANIGTEITGLDAAARSSSFNG